MKKEITKFNQKYQLAQKKLLLAVSGGVDSVVLLDTYKKLGFNLGVAHLNHGIRKESKNEAEHLKQYCQKNNINYYFKKLTTAPKSEEAARKKRYEFLESVRKNNNFDYILTAHHLNDQVETMILKLVRGVGPVELWGMAEKEGNILRPLLSVQKNELESYAKKHKLKYFTDKTNQDLNYSRNRIRIKVIPELERINPKFLKAIARTLRLGQEEASLIKELTQKKSKEVIKEDSLILNKFENLSPEFLKNEILKKYLQKLKGDAQGIYKKNLEEVAKIISLQGVKRTSVGGVKLIKEYGTLKPEQKTTKITLKKALKPEGEVGFYGFKLKLSQKKRISSKNNILLPPTLAYNLNIRTWEEGDRIKTRTGTKKLQDLFTNAKISQSQRKKWPVIVSAEEVIWVPLLAKSEKHLTKSNNESFNLEVIDERKKL